MFILGISAFFHDAAAALVADGEIIAAAQEERFTRKKHDASFPAKSIEYCLAEAGITINDLDAVVFYEKPLLKFERLLESYHTAAPKGLLSFLTSMPVWIKQKLLLKKVIRDELHRIHPYDKRKLRLLFPEHHLSHSASAFFTSPFEEAAILTTDGVGEWTTTSICKGEGKKITVLKELKFPHSLGLLYSTFTLYCGFKVNSGEYKLMGLAPFGNPESEQTKEYINIILDKLCDVAEDGSFLLHQEYFNYVSGLRMMNEKKWESLFGFRSRKPETAIEQHHCNLAFAIQQVTELIIERLAKTAKKITGANRLCLAGGVALNCVANGKLLAKSLFDDIYVQPASGDAGGAIGAALAAYHIYFSKERKIVTGRDSMKGSYLGPSFDHTYIKRMAGNSKAVFQLLSNKNELVNVVAGALSEGKIVGWFQGRMEFGPRALGNRSILADPTDPGMQRKLNLKIKYRESFRPFAPVCKIENAEKYFELKTPSPYMLFTANVKPEWQCHLPAHYSGLSITEKLETVRSKLPAITHVDLSCRIQTVSRDSNALLWNLLDRFENISGHGVLINTSFNVRGEPIVCTPEDAYRCFMNTEMDVLVIDEFIFNKQEQPQHNNPVKTYSKELD
jgi:carbamoyltransferase